MKLQDLIKDKWFNSGFTFKGRFIYLHNQIRDSIFMYNPLINDADKVKIPLNSMSMNHLLEVYDVSIN
jgi:hypothetical protein